MIVRFKKDRETKKEIEKETEREMHMFGIYT